MMYDRQTRKIGERTEMEPVARIMSAFVQSSHEHAVSVGIVRMARVAPKVTIHTFECILMY